jgi:hypothetical protein
MKEMEGKILSVLGFSLVKTTAFQLLELAISEKINSQMGSLCRYIL